MSDQALLWWYPFIAGSAVTVTIIVIGVASAAVRAAWKMVLASEGEPAVCTLISGHTCAHRDEESGHAWSQMADPAGHA